ncbi:MAG: ribonuclease HII [Chlorobi bacterium]|nr:ribonuclease HII [Chlorobiota bacterium]
MNTLSAEERTLIEQYGLVAGVDEAGRGPLAGPVVAAAVVFPLDAEVHGIADSKTLTPRKREELRGSIFASALQVGIGTADATEIDEVNILQATIRAMQRALANLDPAPGFVLVDGNAFHHPAIPFRTVVRGDSSMFTIAAASIIAKDYRDRLMREFDSQYPEYGFARHKGYPTRQHVESLRRFGPSPIHRKSFVVKQLADPSTASTIEK